MIVGEKLIDLTVMQEALTMYIENAYKQLSLVDAKQTNAIETLNNWEPKIIAAKELLNQISKY